MENLSKKGHSNIITQFNVNQVMGSSPWKCIVICNWFSISIGGYLKHPMDWPLCMVSTIMVSPWSQVVNHSMCIQIDILLHKTMELKRPFKNYWNLAWYILVLAFTPHWLLWYWKKKAIGTCAPTFFSLKKLAIEDRFPILVINDLFDDFHGA